MKKYQPDRKDLLINTDWGIPKDNLSKEDADKQQLVLFEKRWVTKEEKKALRKQINAYSNISSLSSSLIFLAVLSIGFNIYFLKGISESGTGLNIFGRFDFMGRMLWWALPSFIAIDLRKFKDKARRNFVLIEIFLTAVVLAQYYELSHDQSHNDMRALVMGLGVMLRTWAIIFHWIFILYLYFNKTAKQIFTGEQINKPIYSGELN